MLLWMLAVVCLLEAVGCGGGAEDANGGLCERCGTDFGICQGSQEVSGDDLPSFCPSPSPCTGCPSPSPCTVFLFCVNELGSPTQRCYPAPTPAMNEVDPF